MGRGDLIVVILVKEQKWLFMIIICRQYFKPKMERLSVMGKWGMDKIKQRKQSSLMTMLICQKNRK